FTVRSGTRTSNFSHESRADLAPGVTSLPTAKLQEVQGFVGPLLFANASQFAIPQAGGDGLGRNIFRGPGYFNLDLGLTKKFDVTERMKVQFRAEAFNALNHANFDQPVSASTGSPSIRSTLFGSACCATVAPPSTQTIIQTGESARVIQFGLKVSF
ncbi:MAG: TonB-dependent receptor, partial [Bryobacteraceae bacterium]